MKFPPNASPFLVYLSKKPAENPGPAVRKQACIFGGNGIQ